MGGIITNGSGSTNPPGIVPKNGFLFEPEFPLNSLKTVPTFSELEQLLDNPYNVALCAAVSPGTLIGATPGTTVLTGSPVVPVYPAYCTTPAVVRRPSLGVTLPPLLVHPLNYNPTNGEEMRLLNPNYPGGQWVVPDEFLQCGTPEATANLAVRALCLLRLNNPNYWFWSYRKVDVTPGAGRVTETEISYNAPIRADVSTGVVAAAAFAAAAQAGLEGLATPVLDATCVTTTEPYPAPEGAFTCGGDPGEPGGKNALGISILPAFGVNTATAYSRPAVPGVASPGTPIAGANSTAGLTARLFDATRGGAIPPRNPSTGLGGLRKPSLRVPAAGGTPANPNYLKNTNPNDVTPSNENDYVRDRTVAAALGKALFWDMQVGSDAVQSCGSCHAHAGADNRVKNQINPNHLAADVNFEVQPPNGTLVAGDFPFQKLASSDVAADPKCTSPMTATINAGVLENNLPNGGSMTVCSAGNLIPDKNNSSGTKTVNDVASSMGVHFGRFLDIPAPGPGAFGPPSSVGAVKSVLPDLRSTVAADNIDPIPGFAGVGGHDIRRVEPRNTPTIFAAALNFDNFWDGRASHDFNGGSVFGASDPQTHVFVTSGTTLVPTRQIIRFVSLASLATGPGLSEFEMSYLGRNWAKIGKKLLQANVTPLANQLVATNDSLLGPYSNQGGSACSGLPAADRSPGSPVVGKPGLCINYPALIQRSFYTALHNNASQHLNGCYTDGRADIHPNQCTSGSVPILDATGTLNTSNIADPFDGYKLTVASGAAAAADTNQFTQMEANFSLFWGLSVQLWAELLMPDNTPFDQFMDQNPDAFEAIGEVGEPGLVGPLPVCSTPTQRHCFREVGNFKRDSSFANANANNCLFPATGEGSTALVAVTPCKGTRNPASNAPDPLLGMDIFQGSNLSLKNPNFRAARCGECHAGGTLTDNTVPFTVKAQEGDFIGEFITAGNEALIEPLGLTRVISGFLLEDELNGNGQDAIERRMANQSIVPCATDGLAYPGGSDPGSGQGFGVCGGAAQSLFDNGVYNLGVTRCEANQSTVTGACDDEGRGGNDAFGWPLSHAAKLLKNLGGPAQQPGTPLPTFDTSLGVNGGLFEESAQDQQINPGDTDDVVNPLAPPYMAPFISGITVGDSMPELDEPFAGLNTLTDTAMLEGFVDITGPFNNAGILNESMNNGEAPQMGTWPMVNRVGRFGSFKAAQLREVELTGPYFHNGGKLTLRQVVDFYMRGGDFPITNATHRDFNMVNQTVEVQSNVNEEERVALVDFLLELTDDRVKFEKGPFDHPQVILPLDGTAPENGSFGSAALRDAVLASCTPLTSGAQGGDPGRRSCMGGLFLDVPAVGTTGNPSGPLVNFLGISSGPRLSGSAATCSGPANNHYCH
jgi:cytochrome c peroxidase